MTLRWSSRTKPSLVILVGLSLGALGVPCVEAHSARTLHVFGDSQCAGASSVAKSVPSLNRWPNVRFSCKTSTRISHWANGLLKTDQMRANDAAIVYLGSNDWIGSADPRAVLNMLAARRVKCLWIGPPLIQGIDNGVADKLKREVESHGACKYLDSRQLGLFQPDGVHPTPQEHVRWLETGLKLLF